MPTPYYGKTIIHRHTNINNLVFRKIEMNQNELTMCGQFCKILSDADVAELADALDSGSSGHLPL